MTLSRTVGTFLLVTVLFGTAFPAIEVGLRFLPPLLFASSRYAVSAVVLIGFAAATTDRWHPRSRRDWTAVVAGGVFLIGGTGLTFLGQQYTTGGVAAIIVSLSPVLTVLLGWVLLPNERVSGRGFLGVLVGFLGVALVVRPDAANPFDPSALGRLLVLVATVSITLGTVLVRRSGHTIPVPALTGWAMLLGASIQFAAGVAVGESIAGVRPTPAAVATVLYLGVFAGALGFVLYFTLLEEVGALEANLVTYLTPVVALAVGALLLDEPIRPAAVTGFLVIVCGFVLLKETEIAAELARYRGAGR